VEAYENKKENNCIQKTLEEVAENTLFLKLHS